MRPAGNKLPGRPLRFVLNVHLAKLIKFDFILTFQENSTMLYKENCLK